MGERRNAQKVIIIEAQGGGHEFLMGSTVVRAWNFLEYIVKAK